MRLSWGHLQSIPRCIPHYVLGVKRKYSRCDSNARYQLRRLASYPLDDGNMSHSTGSGNRTRVGCLMRATVEPTPHTGVLSLRCLRCRHLRHRHWLHRIGINALPILLHLVRRFRGDVFHQTEVFCRLFGVAHDNSSSSVGASCRSTLPTEIAANLVDDVLHSASPGDRTLRHPLKRRRLLHCSKEGVESGTGELNPSQ